MNNKQNKNTETYKTTYVRKKTRKLDYNKLGKITAKRKKIKKKWKKKTTKEKTR